MAYNMPRGCLHVGYTAARMHDLNARTELGNARAWEVKA